MSKMKDEQISKKTGTYICLSLIYSSLIILSACGPLPKDYDAIAACSGMGHKAGTAEYDECVQEESRANLLERHRAETERRHEREEQERIFRRAF